MCRRRRDWTERRQPRPSPRLAEALPQRGELRELAGCDRAVGSAKLADDQIHPGGPITGGIYCDAVRDALQRLAELPPLRTEDEYRYADRPV